MFSLFKHCWLPWHHRWSKWTFFDRKYIYTSYYYGMYRIKKTFKKRTCDRCGDKQEKQVRSVMLADKE